MKIMMMMMMMIMIMIMIMMVTALKTDGKIEHFSM